MLGKLLKYEIRAAASVMTPIYLGVLALAGICSVCVYGCLNNPFFTLTAAGGNPVLGIVTGLSAMMLLALVLLMFILTAANIIQRFFVNLLHDESYLMFTLPVETSTLLLSKLLSALFYLLLAVIISGLALWIVVGIPMMLSIHFGLGYVWVQMSKLAQIFAQIPSGGLYIIQGVIALLLVTTALILTAYLAMLLAQMPLFGRHKILAAILIFCLLAWFFSFISTMAPLGSLLLGGTTRLSLAGWLLIIVLAGQSLAAFSLSKWLMARKLSL